jgi:hypothetical protein
MSMQQSLHSKYNWRLAQDVLRSIVVDYFVGSRTEDCYIVQGEEYL